MIVNGSKAIEQIEIILSSNLIPEDAVKAFEQCTNIIESCDLDECGDGVTVRLENGYELSPHVFEEVERIENATVIISRCTQCGKYDIGWYRE
jgi:hypothetical protein